MELDDYLAIVLVFAIIFEAALLGIAFFNADKVECNYLWCTFTIGSSEVTRVEMTCYQNGIETNCSSMETNINLSELIP